MLLADSPAVLPTVLLPDLNPKPSPGATRSQVERSQVVNYYEQNQADALDLDQTVIQCIQVPALAILHPRPDTLPGP
eukprot:3842762-Rhodomonas_salina.2